MCGGKCDRSKGPKCKACDQAMRHALAMVREKAKKAKKAMGKGRGDHGSGSVH